MPMMTVNCQNCGTPKSAGNFADLFCTDCFAAIAAAQAAASVDGRSPEDARRAALAARAHNAHRNFTDPRALDRRTIWLNGNRPAESA